MTDFAIYEFSGLPKSGKSTVIEIVSTHFRRCGYNVQVHQDFGTYASIGKKELGALNIYLANKAINSILEVAYSKARLPTILLIDRGLFDRLTFSQTLFERSVVSREEHLSFSSFVKLERLRKLVSGVFVFTAPVDLVMQRELSEALNSNHGDVMNRKFLENFHSASSHLVKDLGKELQSIEVVDTGRLDGRIRDTARQVAISIEKSLDEIGFSDPSLPARNFKKYGNFVISKTTEKNAAGPYFINFEGSQYIRYMTSLYTPKEPSKLTVQEVIELCELRNSFPELTIDSDFNRTVVENVTSAIKSDLGTMGEIKILDFGCGDGRSLELLLDGFCNDQLLGIDPSRRSIEEARQKGLRVEHFESGELWSFGEKKFDVVTAFFVMHFNIPLSDLTNLRNETKTGGYFYFNIYNRSIVSISSLLNQAGWSEPLQVNIGDANLRGHRVFRVQAI